MKKYLIVFLIIFFSGLPAGAKKKVVETGNGYKIVEKTVNYNEPVSRFAAAVFKCSACGAQVSSWDKKCHKCGRALTGQFYRKSTRTIRSVTITTREPGLLKELACTHSYSDVRLAAIGKVSAHGLLKEIFMETLYPENRKEILQKIDNPGIKSQLSDLIIIPGYHLKSQFARKSPKTAVDPAVENDLLNTLAEERAREKPDTNVIYNIESKLGQIERKFPKDPSALRDLVMQTPSSVIARQAIDRLWDRTLLKEIALSNLPVDIRMNAVRKIRDADFHLDILIKVEDTEIIGESLTILYPQLKEKELAREIVSALSRVGHLNTKSWGQLAILAGLRIAELSGDHKFVMKMIPRNRYTHGSYSSGIGNLRFIKDQQLLYRIVNEPDFELAYRIDAVDSLTDIGILNRILSDRTLPVPILNNCLRRINNLSRNN